MDYATRQKIYQTIEAERGTHVLAFITSDRPGMETQIAQDCIDLFVDLLDAIGPAPKLSLLLHTNGGHTAAAWRLINLIRTFCDELEVIVPLKALSAGTLISLGADKIIMTKQAALGPIDPSLSHPLGPSPPGGNPLAKVPVSVEAVRGYLDAASAELGITDQAARAQILMDLSNKVHPLVLGEIFRTQAQIRFLAGKLIGRQVSDSDMAKRIIDFLCADSGSHDYTINRREAEELGLRVEKPSAGFYQQLRDIQASYTTQLKLLEPFSPHTVLAGAASAPYLHVRGLVESSGGGCFGFVSEGTLSAAPLPGGAAMVQNGITDQRTFEGWRRI